MFRVTTIDPAKPPRTPSRRDRLRAGFFPAAGVSHRLRPARRRNLRDGAGQDLHVRPDVSRRELEHDAAPGRVLDGRAGGGVLRADGQHGAGRAVPEADLPRRAGRLRRGHGSSSPSTSTRRVIDPLEHIVEQRLPPAAATPRRSRSWKQSGKHVRVSGRVGQRPAGRARALSHRGEVRRAGDPVRLPGRRSSRST